jgi:uncharacterized membrane protein
MQVSEISPRTVGSSGSQRGPRTPDQMPQVPHGTRFRTASRAERMAQRLGWFSIALGLTELIAPSLVARLCGGHGRHTGLIRLYGLREIASGLLIFSGGRRPAAGMWSRVAGDAIDLTTLGAAALHPSTNKAGVAFATMNVLAVTAMDIDCAKRLTHESETRGDGPQVIAKTITVNRSAEEIYRFWRDIANFPRFMYHVQSVRETGPNRSHWIAKAPAGRNVEWEAEVVEDLPNERIAWRSLPGAEVPNAGAVTFEPRTGNRGTIVRVEVEYAPPGGPAAVGLAKLFNESPEQQIYDDLRRLKQILETGEVLRSDGSPNGAGQIWQRPAQPMDDAQA